MLFRFHTMRAIFSMAAAHNFERSYKYGSKGNVIPLQAQCGPEGG